MFLRDIRGGAFVKEWSQEQARGSERLDSLRREALEHAMSRAELDVIAAIQAAHSLDAAAQVPQE
jgi:ketol-acid reductoisomerase